jgi:hypothetical protein
MAKYVNPRYASDWGAKGSYFDKDVAVKIVPVPIAGWDAISPLAAMEPKYAANITNWVPRPGWLELRGGYNVWCQGLSTAPVNTLMVYRPNTGVPQLFAGSNTDIYDCSTNGIPSLVYSASTSDKFQYVNFTPSLGANYLLCVNGLDANLLSYNGTAWSVQTITGTSAVFIGINIFKRRVWLIPVNSTVAYFLGTDAISGAATAQDLGPFMSKGGYLLAMGTWTIDGGQGPDDMAVFLTSMGQAIIYKGTDPTNANAWALVGVFDLPTPIGRKCMCRLGSDLLIITNQGVLPLSQALPFDPSASRSVAVTNRIQNAMTTAAQQYQNNFGWQFITFPQQYLLLMNIPQVENSTQIQYVQNALTGAWTQFTGWNANCFEIFNESLYFGDNTGNVNLAYTSGLDLVSPIVADVQCAFNYLDDPGRLKNANMVRPFLVADGTLTPTIQIDVDFATATVSAPVTILTPGGAVWDSSLWDAAIWSTGIVTVLNWLSCNALGTALAIRMIVNLAGGGSATAVAQTSVFDTGVFDTAIFDGNGSVVASGRNIPILQINAFELALEYGGPV